MKLKLTDLPVVYINLDEQTDRKETLEKIKDLGFKNIIRISGFKDPDLIEDVHILMHLFRKSRSSFYIIRG